jgi:hypothetical protein
LIGGGVARGVAVAVGSGGDVAVPRCGVRSAAWTLGPIGEMVIAVMRSPRNKAPVAIWGMAASFEM